MDRGWEEALREGEQLWSLADIQEGDADTQGEPQARAESEASMVRLPPDSDDDEEEDDLDGLRTHVASRAQNVDALENAAKRRKDDVTELLHQLELSYKKHAMEEVAHARAEVLHGWMQAQLLHLQNAPETKRGRSNPGVKAGSWEALRADVVVDVAHARAGANTELAKRKECEAKLRERYDGLDQARQTLGELLDSRWTQLTASLDAMCGVTDEKGEGDTEQKRGRCDEETFHLEAEVARGMETHAAQASLLKSAKGHYVMVMLSQQERMLKDKKEALTMRLNELREIVLAGSSGKVELEERAASLEKKTNMLVYDNTVLARALTAVEAWDQQLKESE